MIAHITYVVTGSETYSTGATTIPIHAASGYEIIDVIKNGYSLQIGTEVEVDENYGICLVNGALIRGDFLIVLFKQLPRFGSETMVDFASEDFLTGDFA
jgi:hypothetical protein